MNHLLRLNLRTISPAMHGWLPSRGNVLFTLLMLALLFLAGRAGALPGLAPASPNTASASLIAYQGRLADTAGVPLTGSYAMTFALYTAPTGGSALWSESRTVAATDGVFSVMLGEVTPISASIASNTSLYLGVTVGSDAEMTPRKQLGSVAYAFQALTVPDGAISTAKLADGAVTASKLAPGVIRNETTYTLTLTNQFLTTSSVEVTFGTINLPEASDLTIMGMWVLQNNSWVGGMKAWLVVDSTSYHIWDDSVSLATAGIGYVVARNYFVPGLSAGAHTLGVKIDQCCFQSGNTIGISPTSTMWIRALPVNP